jgi:hypothetical protein
VPGVPGVSWRPGGQHADLSEADAQQPGAEPSSHERTAAAMGSASDWSEPSSSRSSSAEIMRGECPLRIDQRRQRQPFPAQLDALAR